MYALNKTIKYIYFEFLQETKKEVMDSQQRQIALFIILINYFFNIKTIDDHFKTSYILFSNIIYPNI